MVEKVNNIELRKEHIVVLLSFNVYNCSLYHVQVAYTHLLYISVCTSLAVILSMVLGLRLKKWLCLLSDLQGFSLVKTFIQ